MITQFTAEEWKNDFERCHRIQYIEGELEHGISIDEFDTVQQFYGMLGYRAKLKKELDKLKNTSHGGSVGYSTDECGGSKPLAMACKKYLCISCGKWRGQLDRHISTVHKVNPVTEQHRQHYFPNRTEFRI